MSGLIKGIKKQFKKVTKWVKKHWKVLLIAAAVVFTAGVALAYFAPSAAAGLATAGVPGFGAGGVFTSTAAALGGGAAATGGAAIGAGGTGAAGTAAAAIDLSLTAAPGAAYSAAMGTAGGVAGTGLAAGAGVGGATAAVTAATVGGGATVAAAAGAATLTEKILLGQMAVQTLAGFAKKDPDQSQKYFAGYNRQGEGTGMRFNYDALTQSMVPDYGIDPVSPKSIGDPKLTASVPPQPQPQPTGEGDDEGLIGGKSQQVAQTDTPFIAPEQGAQDLQGGPSLKQRQDSIQKGYKSRDYSGVA